MLYQRHNSSLHGPYIQHHIYSYLALPGSLIQHQHSKLCSQLHSKSQLLVPRSDKGPVYRYNNHRTRDMSDHSDILSCDSLLHSYLANSMLYNQQLHMSRQSGMLCLYQNNRYQGHDSGNGMNRLVGCQSSLLLYSNSHIQLQRTNQVYHALYSVSRYI